MNAPIGSANVMIVPPKYIAGPSARCGAASGVDTVLIPSGSAHVEQQPENERDDREVVPHDREGAQRRLEPLHLLRLRERGRLLHERDGQDAPRAGDHDLQPHHRRQPGDKRHRVEPDEHAREPGLSRLERQVQQLHDLQSHRRQAEDERDDRRLEPGALTAALDQLQADGLDDRADHDQARDRLAVVVRRDPRRARQPHAVAVRREQVEVRERERAEQERQRADGQPAARPGRVERGLVVEGAFLGGPGGGLAAARGGDLRHGSYSPVPVPAPVPTASGASVPPITPAGGCRSATGSASGSPYSYGPAKTTGVCSKLSAGGGLGTCHSRPRACHGFRGAGFRQTTVDITKLKMKTHRLPPRQNAEIDTQSFSVCRLAAYSKTRRGWPSRPAANSGMNVELNATNIVQKWILPSRSFMVTPITFGSQ